MTYSVDYSLRHASWYVQDVDGERVSDLYETADAAHAERERLVAASGGDVVVLEGVDW